MGQVIESSEPQFFSLSTNPEILHAVKDTGFEVTSMVTVPLRGKDKTIGAIQVLNKEPDAMIDEFGEEDMNVCLEVAEYSGPLIQRMLDPSFEIDDQETAKYIARFTDSPLVASEEDIQIDEKLLEVVGDAIIKREGIFPFKRLSPTSVAALMTNPLDYPRRESFATATDLFVEDVSVAAATLIDKLMKQYFVEQEEAGPVPSEDMASSRRSSAKNTPARRRVEAVRRISTMRNLLLSCSWPIVSWRTPT